MKMITQSEIARKDFDRVCELNDYETFTEKQVMGLSGHIKGLIEKSNREALSPEEINSIHAFNEDVPELKKAIVLNNDSTRETVYYRERKVIFDDVIEKSEGNDIEKSRTGRYANTAQNRKLGRVGNEYNPRGKKAEEEDKVKPEGKKPFNIPALDESLARDYHNREMTLQEVAEELHEAGKTTSVDTEYAKKMVDKFKGAEKKEDEKKEGKVISSGEKRALERELDELNRDLRIAKRNTESAGGAESEEEAEYMFKQAEKQVKRIEDKIKEVENELKTSKIDPNKKSWWEQDTKDIGVSEKDKKRPDYGSLKDL